MPLNLFVSGSSLAMSNFEAEIFSLSLGWGGILVNRPFSNGLFVNLPPRLFLSIPPLHRKNEIFLVRVPWLAAAGLQPTREFKKMCRSQQPTVVPRYL